MIYFKRYRHIFSIICIILFSGFVLHLEGHSLISQTGKVYLWWGAGGVEDSQQFIDWYSFSHFIHGIIFFFLLSFIFKKKYFPESTLLLAVAIEAFWEMLENSPLIINRYREGVLAAGYFGDSILNSTSDICFMILGFLFAQKFGWKICLGVVIFLELFTLYFIRDNLTLNIIMILHPFQSISNWQTGL